MIAAYFISITDGHLICHTLLRIHYIAFQPSASAAAAAAAASPRRAVTPPPPILPLFQVMINVDLSLPLISSSCLII